MNRYLLNSSSTINPNHVPTIDSTRCQHRTPSGRRCRLPVPDPSSALCYTHARPLDKQREAEQLAAYLVGELTSFESAYDINQVLSRLFILLSQDRITSRRAAVLAYIGNLLLRTLPAIDHENSDDADDAIPRIVFDAPPPEHEHESATPTQPQ